MAKVEVYRVLGIEVPSGSVAERLISSSAETDLKGDESAADAPRGDDFDVASALASTIDPDLQRREVVAASSASTETVVMRDATGPAGISRDTALSGDAIRGTERPTAELTELVGAVGRLSSVASKERGSQAQQAAEVYQPIDTSLRGLLAASNRLGQEEKAVRARIKMAEGADTEAGDALKRSRDTLSQHVGVVTEPLVSAAEELRGAADALVQGSTSENTVDERVMKAARIISEILTFEVDGVPVDGADIVPVSVSDAYRNGKGDVIVSQGEVSARQTAKATTAASLKKERDAMAKLEVEAKEAESGIPELQKEICKRIRRERLKTIIDNPHMGLPRKVLSFIRTAFTPNKAIIKAAERMTV